jgi:hypothetical protein
MVPHDDEDIAGLYRLTTIVANGHPTWRKDGGGEHRWIFTGVGSGAWLFGGPDEEEVNFACDECLGITNCANHYGSMPHQVTAWYRAGADDDLVVDTGVLVQVLPEDGISIGSVSTRPRGSIRVRSSRASQRNAEDSTAIAPITPTPNVVPPSSRISKNSQVLKKNVPGSTAIAPSNQPSAVPPYLDCVIPLDHHAISGQYQVIQGRLVNGFPIWKLMSGDRWLYTTAVEHAWMLGGMDEWNLLFECDHGFLTNGSGHSGLMPNEVEVWFNDEDDSDEWHADDGIKFTPKDTASGTPYVPAVIHFTVPNDTHECTGLYRVVNGRTVGGFPLWKHENNANCIFTSKDMGAWMIGGSDRQN